MFCLLPQVNKNGNSSVGFLFKVIPTYNVKGIKGMVCNIFKILDESEMKQLSKVDYNMVKLSYFDYCWKVVCSWSECTTITIIDDDLNERTEIKRNDEFIEPQGLMLKFKNKYFEDLKLKKEYTYINFEDDLEMVFQKHFTNQDLLDYLGIIPFTPSVMINISPDWSEFVLTGEMQKKYKNTSEAKVGCLKKIIDSYMQEQWYEKWEYVIENGSDGKHIHAHIVAKMNTKRLKSVESHLKRGNNTQQLKKYAKGIKGIQGCIKGNSVQKVF